MARTTIFNFHTNHKKPAKKYFVYIFLTWKGTLTDARDGDGGANKITKTTIRTNIVHTSGLKKNIKMIFTICSYIQKMTMNSIHASKITTYDTKRLNNTKIYFQTFYNK